MVPLSLAVAALPSDDLLQCMAALRELMRSRSGDTEYVGWYQQTQRLVSLDSGMQRALSNLPGGVFHPGLIGTGEQNDTWTAFLRASGVDSYPAVYRLPVTRILRHVWCVGQLQCMSVWRQLENERQQLSATVAAQAQRLASMEHTLRLYRSRQQGAGTRRVDQLPAQAAAAVSSGASEVQRYRLQLQQLTAQQEQHVESLQQLVQSLTAVQAEVSSSRLSTLEVLGCELPGVPPGQPLGREQ